MLDHCCGNDVNSLLLQINVICLLLALIGSTTIVKHPALFGEISRTEQSFAER